MGISSNIVDTKIRTKIPLLDQALGGGLEHGLSIAYWSEVEVECSALALQTACNRLKEGDSVVFVSTTKKPAQVLRQAAELGLELASPNTIFIDAFSSYSSSASVGTVAISSDAEEKSSNQFSIDDPSNANELLKKIDKSFEMLKQASNIILIFDSLSSYMDRFENASDMLESLKLITSYVKQNQAVAIFVFTEWAYDTALLEKIRSIFDMIVSLAPTTQTPVYSLRIYKSSDEKKVDSGSLIFFKVLKPGGVSIYLPKILVTGPYYAGKSSFIHSASNGAVSVDRLGTTVALDYAHVDYKGFTIDMFGTPGQTRFDPLLEKLGGQALGLVIIVSATDRSGLSRVKEQIRLARVEGLPYVVALNKVNLRGALTATVIRNLMRIPKKVPIVTMRAKDLSQVKPAMPCKLDPHDVENVLNEIINQILKSEERRLVNEREDLKK
jgi:small GTP-binding protein